MAGQGTSGFGAPPSFGAAGFGSPPTLGGGGMNPPVFGSVPGGVVGFAGVLGSTASGSALGSSTLFGAGGSMGFSGGCSG